MAAILMSMTESVQVSAILEQQLKEELKTNHPEEYQKYQRQQQQQQQAKGVPVWKQMFLVAILFSIEMVAALEQIYSVPIIQYLDVPLSLVSVNGVIAGTGSVLLLPLVGYFTDRGSNPKTRKIATVLASMSSFAIGLSLLLSCGIIKILKFNDYVTGLSTDSTTPDGIDTTIDTNTRANFKVDVSSNGTEGFAMTPGSVSPEPLESVLDLGALPATVFMSILGFALLDIGFDTSTSLTRAFVLETAPSSQHTSILVLATVIQSSAGTALSIIGCFDLSGFLGPLFHTDGTAAMIVVLTILVMFFIIICSSTTMVTAHFLSRRQKIQPPRQKSDPPTLPDPEKQSETSKSKPTRQNSQRENPITLPSEVGESKHQTHWKFPKLYSKLSRGSKVPKTTLASSAKDQQKPFVADILHTERGDASTKPFVLEDSLKGVNYSTIATEVVPPKFRLGRQDSKIEEVNEESEIPVLPDGGETGPRAEDPWDNTPDDEDAEDETLRDVSNRLGHNVSNLIAAIRQSYSLSTSVIQPPLGEFHSRRITQLNQSQRLREEERVQRRNSIFKRQLTFLSISTFFTYGGLIGFAMYSSNALTLGIYKGDPTAPVGTTGRDLYELGLQTAAMGSVVLYAVNFGASLASNKLIQVLGEKLQYLGVSALYVVSSLALVLTERVEIYFVYMAVCGMFRCITFSTPYILAQKFAQERIKCDPMSEVGSEPPSAQFGKVMALIGFLLPLHYAGMSIFLGPLMEVTGNVFTPILYSMTSSICAVIAFIPLFCIKNEV